MHPRSQKRIQNRGYVEFRVNPCNAKVLDLGSLAILRWRLPPSLGDLPMSLTASYFSVPSPLARLLRGAALTVALALAPAVASAQFVLPPLPYAYDALEPHIDKQTMEIHHSRHHQAFINNLNNAAKDNPDLAKIPLDQMQAQVGKLGTGIRNSGGGHYNHDFFWKVMAPADKTGKPSKELEAAIVSTFGSLDEMKKQFDRAALTRFGSGWAWLIVTADKKLAITSTANQDNPLMADVAEVPMKGQPILGLDVWEHAYYLKHQNKRGDYVTAFWNVVNWNQVNAFYAAALKSR